MSPANIEQQMKTGSPLIGPAVAIGDRRPYNVALIVLDPDACAAFAAARGRPDGSVAVMARDDAVLAEVAAGVELTPTMKLKRRPIAEKYAAEIEALYSG